MVVGDPLTKTLHTGQCQIPHVLKTNENAVFHSNSALRFTGSDIEFSVPFH